MSDESKNRARDYLEQKGVATIMEKMAAAMVAERPEDPVAFMEEYLRKSRDADSARLDQKQSVVLMKGREPFTTDAERFKQFRANATRDRPDHCAVFWDKTEEWLKELTTPVGWQLDSDTLVTIGDEIDMGSKKRIPIKRRFMEINPRQWAGWMELPEKDVFEELLYGAHVGLFKLFWGPQCSRCAASTQRVQNLSALPDKADCLACKQANQYKDLDHIKVAFSIHPEVYYCPMAQPVCYYSKKFMTEKIRCMKFSLPTVDRHGWRFENIKLPGGKYRLWDGLSNVMCLVNIKRDATDDDKPVPLVYKPTELASKDATYEIDVEHGNMELQLYSDHDGFAVFTLSLPDDIDECFKLSPEEVPAFTTASDAINHPTFQQFYGNQVVSLGSQIEIEKVTLCFTDVVGSTAQYAKLGDGKAMGMVQDHFDILFRAIRGNEGRIVKTVGDAVMCSYMNAARAVESFVRGIQGLNKFNESDKCPEGGKCEIRVGIHTGAAIVVPLNGINDYFGQNVNTAARIEGKSKPQKILVTEATLKETGVKELIDKMVDEKVISTEEVEPMELKGVADKVKGILLTIL